MIDEFKLKQFSGPLDLLLTLIGEQKLDVSELALSEVTEQYLQHLDQLEETEPEELADFLVIAARLLLLKSKNLLPQFSLEEEEGPSLEEQLRLYRSFVEASKKLNKQWLNSNRAVFRIEPARRSDAFLPADNLRLDSLEQSMVKLLKRLQPPKPLPSTHIDKTITIKEKIDQIRLFLKKNKEVSFAKVLNSAASKTELIMGFLALLELVKQKTVFLNQKGAFNDIVIRKL